MVPVSKRGDFPFRPDPRLAKVFTSKPVRAIPPRPVPSKPAHPRATGSRGWDTKAEERGKDGGVVDDWNEGMGSESQCLTEKSETTVLQRSQCVTVKVEREV